VAKVSSIDSERPAPRVTRLEVAALLLSLAILLALGLSFSIALIPKQGAPSSAADEGPGNPNATYRAEQAVQAWHAGQWYPAHVHSASAGRYFITYDGFSISWHEWVTARRLRPSKP
jgi:hypothetical protein